MATTDRRMAPRHIAIIELDEEFSALDQLLLDFDPTVTAESMSESPRGFVWYALSAEAGDRVECERALTGVLQRLRHAAASGRLPTFRVIVGGGRSSAAVTNPDSGVAQPEV